MRAWQVHEPGEPVAALRLEDVEDPVPGPGRILVRVLAAAVNFPDALLCRGQYQLKPPLPFTPGLEVCGEVIGTGEGVTTPAVGERVVGLSALPHGAFAERTLMEADSALPAPAALDDTAAAAFYISYQTGWFGLHRRAALQPGETLLVHAAAGGVGSAAVQLGKAAGATVIGVVGGPEKAGLARRLGADVVVDRHREDFADVALEVTAGRGADVVYDPVGGSAYSGSARCMAFEGRIVVVGFASGVVPRPNLSRALLGNYTILGLHWGLYARRSRPEVLRAHRELTALADRGVVTPLLGERLRLPDVADGLQRLADGTTAGRAVMLPD
ncbi:MULTISPECIES: NADPH:quinone oxidoreductase family protein [Streptomyces]|uniref:NADPH:quinone oxidoreductase family protein n=1 Tax=Streptomyces TaxID=1883 RepID=UPI0002E8389D|nr:MULTISPECIES: NADPH:quinone oxidoreductase family protein [Streptomyces]MCC3654253.1 NADPH:quinone oxidoreductase family protein [Streptomyces sp. S07_1.15]MZE77765.1 zinc-binding dehydrogenase [Streptomyces sp. SID5475]WSQ71328.1 NADPH:quinone oxidoreductase family protein [Streptomyces xinghaiensis]